MPHKFLVVCYANKCFKIFGYTDILQPYTFCGGFLVACIRIPNLISFYRSGNKLNWIRLVGFVCMGLGFCCAVGSGLFSE